jgi:hypothetical protein
MPDPATLRDSTQIVLPCDLLDGLRDDLDEEFTLTIVSAEGECRIIGSPVEIKAASDYLVRHGVSVS